MPKMIDRSLPKKNGALFKHFLTTLFLVAFIGFITSVLWLGLYHPQTLVGILTVFVIGLILTCAYYIAYVFVDNWIIK